jgi:hypothetical protein
MKLTKGKLTKIRNKKNQSAKRFKKTGKSNKTKTFRKRRALNLHNTSLKKYKGGNGPKLPENVPQVVEPAKPEETVAAPPTTDVVQEMHKEMPTTTDVDQEFHKEIPPTTDVVQESQVEPVMETPTTNVENPGEGPGSHQALPPPVSEVGSDSAEVSSEAKQEMVEDVTPVSELENSSDIGSEDAASLSEMEETKPEPEPEQPEPQQQQPVGNDMSIVAESLDKLAEYISDKIAKKLNLGSGKSSTDLNRDSFNAVANANEALVEA